MVEIFYFLKKINLSQNDVSLIFLVIVFSMLSLSDRLAMNKLFFKQNFNLFLDLILSKIQLLKRFSTHIKVVIFCVKIFIFRLTMYLFFVVVIFTGLFMFFFRFNLLLFSICI